MLGGKHKKNHYDKIYESVDWIPEVNDQNNHSVSHSSFLRKIDTEVNLVSTYRKNHWVSFVDISFDIDADDASNENNSASLGNHCKLDPENEPRKNSEEEKLQFFPSPTSEILPVVKKEKAGEARAFRLVYGAESIPRMGTQGEDAFFVHSRALGVSDGVSGWYQYGIDSAEFSKQLMHNCKLSILKQLQSHPFIDVVRALSEAYEHDTAIGSATATVIALNGNLLNGANLGDSGFICFTKRDNEYVCHGVTKERQHDFNTPFQLSNLPNDEEIKSLSERYPAIDMDELIKTIERQDFCHDQPTAADRYVLELHEDDIVVLGTDGKFFYIMIGFFDNLFKNEIKTIVRDTVRGAKVLDESVAKVIYLIKNRNWHIHWQCEHMREARATMSKRPFKLNLKESCIKVGQKAKRMILRLLLE
eukprot:TRINITY_DN3035_c0_g1_i5.p1 TRINITY_DN3035_c0_g1~~TRINITY_DN3035_c0_g1_i5.p1  ORF type:complete len:419 (-),score=73.20 TRINITY_DN3035_c0_g1_i5:130-1386(-)